MTKKRRRKSVAAGGGAKRRRAHAPSIETNLVVPAANSPTPAVAEVKAPANDAKNETNLAEDAKIQTTEVKGCVNEAKSDIWVNEFFGVHLECAEAGVVWAMAYVAMCYELGFGPSRNVSLANRWYETAANAGNVFVQAHLWRSDGSALSLCLQGWVHGYGLLGNPIDHKKAIEFLEKSAELGFLIAQNTLGHFMNRGRGCDIDKKGAMEWFRRAAEGGYPAAQLNYAHHLRHSSQNESKKAAVDWYKRSAANKFRLAKIELFACIYEDAPAGSLEKKDAEEGLRQMADKKDAWAQFHLGTVLLGNNQQTWKQEGMELLLKAAAQGNSKACRKIGECYQYGQGVTKDLKVAIQWHLKAAHLGLGASQETVGNLYMEGDAENKHLAYQWFLKAVQNGEVEAYNNLGVCLKNGIGCAKDEKQAAAMFRKAAEAGMAVAQHNVALCYRYGTGMVEQNLEVAFSWFSKAAQQNYHCSQNQVAFFHEHGMGGAAKDAKKAFDWYMKAALQNYPFAQCKVGVCYFDGKGVEKNWTNALHWFRQSANQNYNLAAFYAGECLYKGENGVVQNLAEAFKFFQQAAVNGYHHAHYDVAYCLEWGDGTEKNMAQALKWYQDGANLGDHSCQMELARLYAKGLGGLPIDRAKALHFYRKSAEEPDLQNIFSALRSAFDSILINGCWLPEPIVYLVASYGGPLGWSSACLALGKYLLTDDPPLALNWLKRAADQNDPEAAALIAQRENQQIKS